MSGIDSLYPRMRTNGTSFERYIFLGERPFLSPVVGHLHNHLQLGGKRELLLKRLKMMSFMGCKFRDFTTTETSTTPQIWIEILWLLKTDYDSFVECTAVVFRVPRMLPFPNSSENSDDNNLDILALSEVRW